METKTPKRDVYEIITSKIIERLEQGIVPWRQPWHEAGMPQNLISMRPYRGINMMLLALLGYEKNYFLTSKQLKEIGGSIKSSEKPNIVVFWNWVNPKEEETESKKKVPFLRYYTVFNVAQCEGIPESLIPTAAKRKIKSIPLCEQIVEDMQKRPKILHKENRAYYNPALDLVNVPVIKNFNNDESYYRVLFHELIHSTGHVSRLNRKGLLEMSEFGSEPYSYEELIAEIGACFLESFTGIESEQFEQNVAYIGGWLKKLKNDKRFVVQASAAAQKATDYILNLNSEDNIEEKQNASEKAL